MEALKPRVADGTLKLKANRYGRLDLGWGAVTAGIPRSSAYLEPIKQAIAGLADIEGATWLPRVSISKQAFERPGTSPEQLEAWRRACSAHDRAIRQEDVDAALDNMVVLDAELSAGSERLPWSNGSPHTKECSRRLSCSPLVLRHQAVQEGLLELARRHGVVTIHTGKKVYDPKQKYHRAGLLRDDAEWLRIRGEAYAINARGHVDYVAAATRIGLHEDIVLKTSFRREVDKHQRRLVGGAGVLAQGSAEFAKLEAESLLDIVEEQIDLGGDCWVIECDRLTLPQHYERRLRLAAGITNRFPELRHRCVEIYSRLLEIRSGEHQEAAHARRINFIADGILALAPKYKANGRGVEVDLAGSVSMRAIERDLRTRFPGEWQHELVIGAVKTLVEEVGTSSPVAAPKPDADLLISVLCRTIKRRGFGFAWSYDDRDQFRSALSAETLLAVSDITDGHLDEVERAIASVRALGMDQARPRGTKSRVAKGGHEALLARALALPKYDDGLPAHPAGDDILDYEDLSAEAGIEPRSLRKTPSYAKMISEKIEAVGLKPFNHLGNPITFAQLKIAAAGDRSRVAAALAEQADEPMPATYARRINAALNEVMIRSGLSPSDLVGTSLDAPRDRARREFDAGMEIAELRLCHARLTIQLTPGMSLAGALGLLCRAAGYRPGTLHQATTLRAIVSDWALLNCSPTWAQEDTLRALAAHFGMSGEALSQLVNGDHRRLGTRAGRERIPHKTMCHLPFNYWQLDAEVRHELLNDITLNYASFDSPEARRKRVQQADRYRLKHKAWPERLRQEASRMIEARQKSASPAGRTLMARATSGVTARKPLRGGGKGRLRAMLETFFGFLTRPRRLEGPPVLVHPKTPDWLRDKLVARLQSVQYEVRGGLEIDPEKLTFGALGVVAFVDEFLEFAASRRGDVHNRDALTFVTWIRTVTRKGAFCQMDAGVVSATSELLKWWEDNLPEGGMITETRVPTQKEFDDKPQTVFDEVTASYDVLYTLLKEMRDPKHPNAFKKTKDPFARIACVVWSRTPVAIYRACIAEMIANKPERAHKRHLHLRDCILAILLLQTYLRIKNLAQLTYKANGLGQIFREESVWKVKIHKDRFKNRDGAFFKDGDFFEMELIDDLGLYEMLERYVTVTREYIGGLEPRASSGSKSGDRDEDDDDEDPSDIPPEEDEDGDAFGDDDPDGEAESDRFFWRNGGREFKPSGLAAHYYRLTNRYLAESPYRNRGLKGLRPHGPHAVRHVGATDALMIFQSFEVAARRIHDGVHVTRKTYVHWTPGNQLNRARDENKRSLQTDPVFDSKVILLRDRVPNAGTASGTNTRSNARVQDTVLNENLYSLSRPPQFGDLRTKAAA